MKKILALLSSIGLLATTSLTVVACTNNEVKRFDTPTLEEKLRDQMIMELLQDPEFGSITNGKYFNSIDFKDVVLKMVQETTSKLANNHYNEQWSKSLKSKPISKDESFQQTKDRLSKIAQNEFYIQYTTRLLADSKVSLDSELSGSTDNLFLLNPQDLIKTKDEIDPNDDYYIYYNSAPGVKDKWYRWNFYGENKNAQDSIPSIEQLETSQFVITNDGTEAVINADIVKDKDRFYIDAQGKQINPKNGIYSKDKDGQTVFVMNGKTALEYRFQQYFNAKIKTTTFQNLLTSTFLANDTFTTKYTEPTKISDLIELNQDLYYKSSSDLLKYVQSWNKNDGYKSNLKMVWSATFDTKEKAQEAYGRVESLLNSDGSFIDSNKHALKEAYELIKADNKTNIGTDPFLGMKGFNGFVQNDGDSVKSVDGTFALADSTKTLIAKANSPAIFANNGQGYESKQVGKFDIALVLPIYAVDLFSDKDKTFDYGQSTTLYKAWGVDELWTSLDDANNKNAQGKISDSKKDWINQHQNGNITNILLVDKNNATLTLDEWNKGKTDKITPENIWSHETVEGLKGFQANIKNTLPTANTFGNVAIGQDKVVLTENFEGLKPTDTDKIKFTLEGKKLSVSTPNDPSLIGTVQNFGTVSLSFDKGSTGNVYTRDEIHENGRTVSYKINLGSGSDHPNDMVVDGPFNFYLNGQTSLDVTNLNKTKKRELLEQVEYIVSKKDGMSKNAEAVIYPLFLKNDKILYKPLYEALKEYLEDKSKGGSSD
ncbi:hypothetical protein ELUMI_v1c03950 [Williamsoniiplasma luminosum]|uniref:Lipoprotein n=1 Tax=Williamsoniiplasma luminosum TaxID=214888 RepID=A0A2K8NTF8_9MOLU|nr:lipoprotein [Williamsoniiplasma luminosum]ATZ17120.1 hypothetical protein ELUMI_v1c03950 [Williamsoniiplasma luminosum]